MKRIWVITEGATEREVGRVLHEEHDLLGEEAEPAAPLWRQGLRPGRREGYDRVIRLLAETGPIFEPAGSGEPERMLLVFDQEQHTSPRQAAQRIQTDLRRKDHTGSWEGIEFHPVDGWRNLFQAHVRCGRTPVHVLLHISNAQIKDIPRRDFDGYVLQLLQGPSRESIARRLAPTPGSAGELLRKAEQEIDALMRANGFPWTHAKSWLYAYITVFQFRGSHVRFASEVVRYAPRQELEQVFASLCEAWRLLAEAGGPQ
jgi:hypothetical protein